MKVVDALKTPGDGEILGDGLAGLRLCKDSFMPVKYHKCDDGRIIFGKDGVILLTVKSSRFIKPFFSVSRPLPMKIFRSRWL